MLLACSLEIRCQVFPKCPVLFVIIYLDLRVTYNSPYCHIKHAVLLICLSSSLPHPFLSGCFYKMYWLNNPAKAEDRYLLKNSTTLDSGSRKRSVRLALANITSIIVKVTQAKSLFVCFSLALFIDIFKRGNVIITLVRIFCGYIVSLHKKNSLYK